MTGSILTLGLGSFVSPSLLATLGLQATGTPTPTPTATAQRSDISGGGGAGFNSRRYKKRDAELISLMPVILSMIRRK